MSIQLEFLNALPSMFSSLKLFQNLSCPERINCTRPRCIFSHRDPSELPSPPMLNIPYEESSMASSSTRQSVTTPIKSLTVPAKRAVVSTPFHALSSSGSPIGEPPRKLQKLGSAQKPSAVPTASHTTIGVPILRINAAQSQVAIPVRQAMLKTLYDHFTVLYDAILPTNPTLASEHALRQEEQVYKKSNKITYRNAVIQCAAGLKRRPIPDSASHASVGTEDDLAARAESRKSLDSLHLTRAHLEPLILSIADMQKWGYFVDIPDGTGGEQPSLEGRIAKCERCAQPFQVKRKEEADECIYHWGKPYTTTITGERMRVYTCCSRLTAEGEGCIRGPHVFYESKVEDLHSRHPFSFCRPPEASGSSDTALDVAALDCEMIYTTGGMRVARVSVVDGSGAEVFDQLVRMDEGVGVIDYNTRFSGITAAEHSKALLPLASIRKSLDSLINSNTILIGHALDNDLKTLRIIHSQCVDTAILFPHRAGPPYRRALRDLVREHLGITIQSGGGSVGHSSVEDSIATLDLVRWHVLSKPNSKPSNTIPSSESNRVV